MWVCSTFSASVQDSMKSKTMDKQCCSVAARTWDCVIPDGSHTWSQLSLIIQVEHKTPLFSASIVYYRHSKSLWIKRTTKIWEVPEIWSFRSMNKTGKWTTFGYTSLFFCQFMASQQLSRHCMVIKYTCTSSSKNQASSAIGVHIVMYYIRPNQL